MTTKVIVSGMGLVCPLGENATSSWNTLCPEQKKQPSTSFALGKRSDKSGLLRAEEMAESATREALAQAGFLWDSHLVGIDPERVGCIVSASKPLTTSFPAVSSGESMDPLPVAAGDDV